MKSSKFLLVLTLCFAGIVFSSFIQSKSVKVGTNIGEKAPELKYMNPLGKEMALSSIKGKIVLIDFWASWCMPCRIENPNIVKTYEKYKDSKFKNAKGFTIYGVSLDNNQENWTKAIEKDKLNWEYHVSDLGGWNSAPAKVYGVNSIPSNFLLNEKGIIIGRNLRGPALEAELMKYLAE